MTKIYLHIGLNKTGTSFLQTNLANNYQILIKKNILYPCSGRPKTHHTDLVPRLKFWNDKSGSFNEDEISKNWQKLYKEIEVLKPDKVIISAEGFGQLGGDFETHMKKVELIKKYLKDYSTMIIVYLRRQDNFYISNYQHLVGQGRECRSINSFINSYWANLRGDYYQFLSCWRTYFSKKNIIVRVYEKEQLPNFPNGLMYNFLEIIDPEIDINKFTFKQTVNQSPRGKLVKIMRVMSQISVWTSLIASEQRKKFLLNPKDRISLIREYQRINSEQRKKLYKLYFDPKSSFIDRIIPNFLINDRILSNQDRISIIEKYERINSQVAKEFLGREDGCLFYEQQPQ